MAHFDPWDAGSRVRYSEDFITGLKCFRNEDWEGALGFFRAAAEGADIADVYKKRYTSFHGLTRVQMGDRNGVKLCREAAVSERYDAEVFITWPWPRTSSASGRAPIPPCAGASRSTPVMPDCSVLRGSSACASSGE